MTGCDEPYMGEESIMRPPASKKAAMTLAHSSLSSGSPPTLKVIQVPSPTIGMASRVEGMSRRAGEPSWAGREIGKKAAAAVAKEACTNVRRVVRIRCSIIVAGKFLQNARSEGNTPAGFRGTRNRAAHSLAPSGGHQTSIGLVSA